MAAFGAETGGVDLKSLAELEFGGALGTKEGRRYAKVNGRKLMVDKSKVKEGNQKSLMPRMILVLKSADED